MFVLTWELLTNTSDASCHVLPTRSIIQISRCDAPLGGGKLIVCLASFSLEKPQRAADFFFILHFFFSLMMLDFAIYDYFCILNISSPGLIDVRVWFQLYNWMLGWRIQGPHGWLTARQTSCTGLLRVNRLCFQPAALESTVMRYSFWIYSCQSEANLLWQVAVGKDDRTAVSPDICCIYIHLQSAKKSGWLFRLLTNY